MAIAEIGLILGTATMILGIIAFLICGAVLDGGEN
jgi:hypothetical protein